MKITHFNNAFLAVAEGGTRLLCDPWIGTANYGGWISYPIVDGETEVLRTIAPTHLYISHLHADHLCRRVLEKLPDPGIPVCIKRFADGVLRRRLSSFGLRNVVELEPWMPAALGDGLEAVIVPADVTNSSGIDDEIGYDLDTSIIVRSRKDGTVFFNTVDNPMSVDQFRRVREFVAKTWDGARVHAACIGVGASSEYPQCFMGIDRPTEQSRVIEASLKKFAAQLAALGNEAYFPAGGTYVIPGKYSGLNRFIAQPTLGQLRAVAAESGDCKSFFSIEGGGSIERVDGKWLMTPSPVRHPTKAEAIVAHASMPYEYGALPAPSGEELLSLFAAAKRNYFSRLQRAGVPVRWRVGFRLYSDLRLDGDAAIDPACQPHASFVLEEEGSAPEHELVCHLDDRLFAGLLRRDCVWNISLSGSIIMFERRPNIFVPAIPFSLNYLTA